MTYFGSVEDGVGGVNGLDGASAVTVSPDGKRVYATGSSDDAVAVFTRESSTGALGFVQIVEDDVGSVDGLNMAIAVAVSPDG